MGVYKWKQDPCGPIYIVIGECLPCIPCCCLQPVPCLDAAVFIVGLFPSRPAVAFR